MILITFPFAEDAGIKVIKAALERQKDFFVHLQLGKVKNEKARLEKIFLKCKKLSQKGGRIDAVVLIRSSLSDFCKLKTSFAQKGLSESLKQFFEEQKNSRSKLKPEFLELNKTDFPFQLKNLQNFSGLAFLIEISFIKSNPLDYDLRKFRKKKSSESLLLAIKNLKKFLKDLEAHCRKKAASASRKRSKEISELTSSLEGLEKHLITERKKLELEQDKVKRPQLETDWRKNGEDRLFRLFMEIVWPKLTEKSAYTLSHAETTDAAGRNLSIKMPPSRAIADVFLSGTGALEILKRSPVEKMPLISFYEKLCKGELPDKWREKFGVKR